MASGASPQTAHLPFSGGIDQRTHPRHLQAPRLKQCDNGRLVRAGAISKRPGNDVLEEFAPGTVCTRISTHRDELLVFDRHYLRSWSPHTSTFEIKGQCFEAIPSMHGIASSPTTMSSPDQAYAASTGLLAIVWSDAANSGVYGRVRSKVIDTATGIELQSGTIVESLSSYGPPRVAVVGSTIIMVYGKESSGNIYGRILSSDGKTWGNAVTMRTDNLTGGANKLEIAASSSLLYLAYQATGPVVKVVSYSAALSQQVVKTTSETQASVYMFGLAVEAPTRLWVAYAGEDGSSNGNAKVMTLDLGLAAETLAPTEIWNDADIFPSSVGVCVADTDYLAVLINAQTQNGSGCVMAPMVSSVGNVVPLPEDRRTYWSIAASKPFRHDTNIYAWIYTGGTIYHGPTPPVETPAQYSLTLVDLQTLAAGGAFGWPARPICADANRFASPELVFTYNMCTPLEIESNLWSTIGRIKRSNNGRVGLVNLKADFAHPNQGQQTELGEATQYTPGFSYDGARAYEYSFSYWPQQVTVEFVTGGSLTVGKRYRWRAVYVYIDDTGQIDRSAPSDYCEATATDTKAQVTIPAQCLTLRQTPVSASDSLSFIGIELYRTTEDPTDDTPYYLVFNDPAENDVNEESILIEDGEDDDIISTHPQIYTQGGALRRVQPPGFAAVATYRNRQWGAHGNTLWYSGAFVEGESVWWSDTFTQPIDTPDDITALWVMDDTLYVSTATRVYYLQAEGPTDTGALNDVGVPLRVATDLGCIEPRSVIVTPIGTLYQSPVGIHMLDRARKLPPQVFGLRVQDTLRTYPTIVSATTHPDGGYVMFWCTNGTTSVRIVYDYTADEWFTDTSQLFGALNSAVVLDDTVTWANADAVYTETDDYLDDGKWVVRTVEMADYHPTGVQGFMKFLKVKFLGDQFTPHGLVVSFAKDYATSSFDSRSFSDSELTALSLEQIDITPQDSRCQAMRIKIVDVAPSVGAIGTGQGTDLIAASIDFDPLGNQFQLPTGARK